MGSISKEQKMYLEGMVFALKIAKEKGIDELEKEVKYRGGNAVPCNISRHELIMAARAGMKDELMILATAMADTMSSDMKLPPSMILDFLNSYNANIDKFREDKEAMEKAQLRLDSMYGLKETIKRFKQEEE